ncbi:MAG TPA: hypothetical protein DDW50_00940, partial [Firmicutes bacterium]|nr:hypothetical protein [Bacillota bacterium]
NGLGDYPNDREDCPSGWENYPNDRGNCPNHSEDFQNDLENCPFSIFLHRAHISNIASLIKVGVQTVENQSRTFAHSRRYDHFVMEIGIVSELANILFFVIVCPLDCIL